MTDTRGEVESLLHIGVVLSACFGMWRRRPVIVESPRPAAAVLAQLEATSIRHVWLCPVCSVPVPAQPQILRTDCRWRGRRVCVWIGLVAAGLTVSVVAEMVNIALGHWHRALRTLAVVGVLASFAAFFVGLTTVATRLARPEEEAVMRWLADACGVPTSSPRV